PDLHRSEEDLGRLDLQRDPSASDRPHGPRLPRVEEPDAPAPVDDLAVEDVRRLVAAGDHLGRVPAVALEVARPALLVAYPLAAEDARPTPVGLVEEGRRVGVAGLGVDPGVELHAVEREQVADVGLLDLELERARPDGVGPSDVVVEPRVPLQGVTGLE